jgi:hypothetical protein
MSISEAQRFDMQVGLRQQLGDDVANTLMEHLPPSGWSDVARTREIERLHHSWHCVWTRIGCTSSADHAQHLAPLRHHSLAQNLSEESHSHIAPLRANPYGYWISLNQLTLAKSGGLMVTSCVTT